tara:strand:+ start:7374 stop:8333 length:960 start_codon:yes stop_codon:yes gene_type:complete
MGRQVIQIGTTANDGTGTTIRAGGDLINNNFNEIYSTLGDGSTLAFTISGVSNGQALVYNSSTSKFEPGTPGVSSAFTIAGDGGSNQTISSNDTLTVQGGTGITTTGVATDKLSIAIDSSVATLTGSQTLTNKTINGPDNTLTNIANGSLANSSIAIGGVTLALGATDATPAFNLSDATAYPTSSLVGTISNAQLTGSITNAKLSNSTISVAADSGSTDPVSLGETLTFTGAGGLTTAVSANTITLTTGALTYTKSKLTGDGSTTAFTINSGRAVDNLLVFVNGICLVPTDDYTVSGTTLTFVTAPAASAEITVRFLPI